MSVFLMVVVSLVFFTILGGCIFAIINCVQSEAELKESGASSPSPNASYSGNADQEK